MSLHLYYFELVQYVSDSCILLSYLTAKKIITVWVYFSLVFPLRPDQDLCISLIKHQNDYNCK